MNCGLVLDDKKEKQNDRVARQHDFAQIYIKQWLKDFNSVDN